MNVNDQMVLTYLTEQEGVESKDGAVISLTKAASDLGLARKTAKRVIDSFLALGVLVRLNPEQIGLTPVYRLFKDKVPLEQDA